MAEYDKKIIRADYLPTAGLSVQYSGTRIKDLAEDFEYTPLIAGQVSIPLFAWGQGKQKQKSAQIAMMKQQKELEEATEQIKLEVMNVRVQIEEAFQSIKIAEKNIAETEENLEETKISFEVGLNTTTELLNAQVSWMQAKAQLITAKAKFRILETSWLRVTGRLN
jgi:outer membrane protein TolC